MNNKLLRYALYQERCTQDIQRKLLEWKVPAGRVARMLTQLAQEGILDDQRFASSFVRGKFRSNRWGRIRILHELRAKQIPEKMIRIALEEIGEREYQEAIRELILKKGREINPDRMVYKREKIINFVVGKGFEPELVLRVIREIEL